MSYLQQKVFKDHKHEQLTLQTRKSTTQELRQILHVLKDPPFNQSESLKKMTTV